MSFLSQAFHILRLPILVFFVNAVLDATGIYVTLPWIDMPMHFLGGASIAVAGITLLAFLRTQGFVNELPFLLAMLFIMSFVGLAAVSWELWEFSSKHILNGNIQVDLPDTMIDMFFGLLGGLVTLISWLYFRKGRL